MKLRGYQKSIFEQVVASSENLLVQLDTGAGKTPIIAKLAKHYGDVIIVCHLKNLIKQASEKLAMCGVKHRIVGANDIKRVSAINNFHQTNNKHLDVKSKVVLLSIDTFASQFKSGQLEFDLNTSVILIDEAHHVAENNKWDVLIKEAKARFIGFTATPLRADNEPLTTAHGGAFDRIIQAKGYEENGTERLITEGYLADYRAFYAQKAFHESAFDEIVLAESAIWAYEKYSKGRKTLITCPLIANADELKNEFERCGYRAESVHSELSLDKINRTLEHYKNGNLNILIFVDMFAEGFDVPASSLLIFARSIGSFGMYRQFCGRVLRPGESATIVDLTGESISKHGLPSDHVNWNEEQRSMKPRTTVLCLECGCFYKQHMTKCPSCGASIKAAEGAGISHLHTKIISGKILEKKRKMLERKKADEIKQRAEDEEAFVFNSDYRELSPRFQNNIVGERLNQLFSHLQSTLKEELTAYEFNLFFICYQDIIDKIEFYTLINAREWSINSKEASIKLYKRHLNDLHKQFRFEKHRQYKR